MSAAARSASVSSRASDGFDHFVMQAARNAMALPGEPLDIQPLEDGTLPKHTGVTMLTVSSYLFRALLFIHHGDDAMTRAHFAGLAHADSPEIDDERFIDAVMECGNLVCGALNRELAAFYPHTGMSTPCRVDDTCLAHVQAALGPALVRRYRALAPSGVCLHMTLAVCAFGDLDFPFEASAAVEETAGELELF